MKRYAALLLFVTFLSGPALAQNQRAQNPSSSATATPQLSQDQIRALIRQAADKDIENDKKQSDYTYIQREEEHKLDGEGTGEVERIKDPGNHGAVWGTGTRA